MKIFLQKHTITAWLVWLFAVLFLFYEFILRLTPSIISDTIMNYFGISNTGFGLLTSCYLLAYALMQIPAGIIIDRYGARKIISLSFFIIATGALLFAKGDNLKVATLGRILIGIGSSSGFIGMFYICSVWFTTKKLTTITAAIGYSIASIGSITTFACGNIIMRYIDWISLHLYFFYIGIILGVIGIIAILKNRKEGICIARIVQLREQAKKEQRNIVKHLLNIKNRYFILNALASAFFFIAVSVFASTWAPLFFKQQYRLSQVAAGQVTALLYVGWIIGNVFNSYLTTRFQEKTILFATYCSATVISIFIFYYQLSFPRLQVAMLIFGMALSAQTLQFRIATDYVPSSATALALAMTNFIVIIISSIANVIFGMILDADRSCGAEFCSNNWHYATALFPICSIVALVLMLYKYRSYKMHDA